MTFIPRYDRTPLDAMKMNKTEEENVPAWERMGKIRNRADKGGGKGLPPGGDFVSAAEKESEIGRRDRQDVIR